jgi:hypothetical protein
MSTPLPVQNDPLEAVFLPLHKRAFGMATGAAAAFIAFLITAISLLRPSSEGPDLGLISEYFAGYSVSWPGAFIGAAWAAFTGFIMGWFLAFCRNLFLAVRLFVLRTRAELAQDRDFLDHI